jgi:hypothetical protein
MSERFPLTLIRRISALAIIMFGTLAFFLAGQGINSGFGSTYSNTSKVSGLLASAGYIKTGFDAVTLGGTLPASVTFDTTDTTGVFNPTTGGAVPQSVDPTLIDSTLLAANNIYGYWIYRKNALTISGVGVGVGVAATADYTMMVAGLKQGICQQINNTLHGISLITAPPTIAIADIALVGALAGPPTAAAPTNAGNAQAVTSTWMNGCYTTADSHYVYIYTLLAQ